jgi:peptidyl-prolyl cis-trans isomerase C
MALRAIIALLLSTLIALPAVAAEKKPPAAEKSKAAAEAPSGGADPIVANINGTIIHRSDMIAYQRALPEQARNAPLEKIYGQLMDQVIANTLAEQQARKEGLQNDPEVRKRLAEIERSILVQAWEQSIVRHEIANAKATDEKLHQLYEQYAKHAGGGEEVCARHILVANEDEAKAIIVELKKGADFATLAKEKTSDPSGKTSGGDLGCFRREDMVKEFADAAFELKKGEISQTPVKSQFGWHVIKVEDRRQAKPATFEEIKPKLEQELGREIVTQRLQAMFHEAKAANKIDIRNPDGSKLAAVPEATSTQAQQAQSPAPAAQMPAGGDTPAPAHAGPTLAPATAPDQMKK